ncbi:MAG: dihydrodipicolinate synthase family protein [Gemmatimonadetes bacterium]|nr:dihydrodipicolinate synthase family protein [Gemmatimonadota bacterium]MCC6770921.1 dihydrodipicolinate synthase family protein [Gemmatimonadaceae bacterium]
MPDASPNPPYRLDADSRGVFVISATPFHPDGSLDLASLDRALDFYLHAGVHGITLLGMMGEAHKLTSDEGETIVRRGLARVGGRVPVVVGVSGGSLPAMKSLAHLAMDAGAAGAMVAPPYGLRTDDAIVGYMRAVAHALGPEVPLVFQDYPPTTGVYVSPACLRRVIDEVHTVAMYKGEDVPGLDKISNTRAAERAGGRRVSVVCGNGGLLLPQALARGADGIMTGFSYPEMLVQVYEAHVRGEPDAGEDLYDAYLPLVSYENQPGFGLAVRKEILRRRGAIASAAVRAPGPVLSRADLGEIDRLLARIERRSASTTR